MGLADDGGALVKEFSRGMKQRLGIAEVLVKNPIAVFLDEPTRHRSRRRDPHPGNDQELNREHGLTVMLSSHQLQQVQEICTRVGIIVKGK